MERVGERERECGRAVCVCVCSLSVPSQCAPAELKMFDTDTVIEDRQIKRVNVTVGGMGGGGESGYTVEGGRDKNDGMLVE